MTSMFAKGSSSIITPSANLVSSSGTVLDQLDALPGLKKPKYQRLTMRRQELEGSKLKKKTKEDEEEEKRFIAAVNQVLVQVPRDKIHTVWLRLFAERMHASQTLTTPQQMEHYMSVFTDWLEVVPPSEANSVNRKLALAFLSGFASTHSIDPDNSIIGLQASEKAIAMALKVREEQQADYDSYAKLLRLEPGDLCLVKKTSPDRFVWGRVAKVLPMNRFQIYFDPMEIESEILSSSETYPLGDQLASNTGSLKLQEKLIFSPAEDFFTQLNTEIRNRSSQYLQDQGINLPLLRRLSRNEFTLSDWPILKQVRAQLSKILDNLETTEFFKSIKAYAAGRVQAFMAELKPEQLFPPTRNRVLENLKVAQFAALARVDIQKYIAVCESTLDLIVLERRKLMGGETKNYLTEWWLTLIRDEVERWLTEQGYDHEAVPYNYIQQAPTSLEACRKNLQMLQGILSTLGDKTQPVHQMITRLKNEIYPKIDEFIEKSQLVICEHLGMEPTAFTPQIARQTHEAKMKDGTLKESVVNEQLSNLILDLEYLQEMKHLEDHPPTAGGLKLGVVPISGVIVGYFYRYENELITVLDVWGGGSQPATPAHPAPSMIEQSLAAVARNRAPSVIDAANLTDNAYLGETLKREQISFLRLSAMNITERKEFINEQSHTERLRRSREDFRGRLNSDSGTDDQQISALLNDFTELQAKQLQILKQMCERDEFNRATIRKLRTELARVQEREFTSAAAAIAANSTKKVVLNVGGVKYTTTTDTFAREPESQLTQLVSSARYDTEVFIDRDGAVFAHVLNYLRDGVVSGVSDDLRNQLSREAKFFGLAKLQTLLDSSSGRLSPKASSTSTPTAATPLPTPTVAAAVAAPVAKSAVPAPTRSAGSTTSVATSTPLTRTDAGTTRSAIQSRPTVTPSSAAPIPTSASANVSLSSSVTISPTPSQDTRPAMSGSVVLNNPSRPSSEQATAAATVATTAANAPPVVSVPATIPPQFVGNTIATQWYLFLLSAQVPEDSCISYANVFMEKNMKPEQVSGMSQQMLKDIGIKMGHIMKLQKAKPPAAVAVPK